MVPPQLHGRDSAGAEVEAEVEAEDAAQFVEGLGVVVGTVRTGDDALGVGAGQVGTRVIDDTVGTFRAIALAAVADDRVVGDLKRDGIDDLEDGAFWR